MNMLIKEECEKALENLRILERKDNFKKWGGQVAPQISCDIFEQLISEHFDPQPYKFEELKKGMWVWDDKEKECIYITKTFISISGFNVFTYLGIYQNLEELKKLDMLFEENRFFSLTKALEYQR